MSRRVTLGMRFPTTILRLAAALGCGLLMASAFPPFEGAEAGWVALIPLLLLASCSRPWQAFRWGWVAGMTFWLLSVSWLLRMAATGGALPLVILAWLSLAAYCALYIAAFALVAAWLFRFFSKREDGRRTVAAHVALVLLLPIVWVGFEFLRSTLFTGFPWNTLAVSQYRNLAVIQLAQWGGVYAVSFVLVVLNVALGLTFLNIGSAYSRGGGVRRRVHVELMIGLLIAASCWTYGLRTVRRLDGEAEEGGGFAEVRVAAVQPNVLQLEKWTAGFELEIQQVLREHTEYAAQCKPHLVVWPETSVVGSVAAGTDSGEFVAELARRTAPLLVGAMEVRVDNDHETYYNSSFLFEADGGCRNVYRKQHLVAFGEYVPFSRWIPALEALAPLGISCSAGTTGTVFELPAVGAEDGLPTPAEKIRFSTLICFEDAFAGLARKAVGSGAQFLINQTNDGWFDGWLLPGWAARQHMSHCVFRCVENRVPAVRSANTGVTCFIDRAGRIEDREVLERQDWKMRVAGFSVSSIMVSRGAYGRTYYGRFGDVPFALPCGVAAALAFVLAVLDERRKNAPVGPTRGQRTKSSKVPRA